MAARRSVGSKLAGDDKIMPTDFHQIQSNSHRGRTVTFKNQDTVRNSEGDEEVTVNSTNDVQSQIIQATNLSPSTTVPDLNETMVGELPDNSYILRVPDISVDKEDVVNFDGQDHDIHRIVDLQGDDSQKKGKVIIVTR